MICWTVFPRQSGSWPIAAMTPIGSGTDWRKGISPCIPSQKSHTTPVSYDKHKYRRRNRIEIMISRLKDWQRGGTCYDRCPTFFFSVICLAATVMFWYES